MSSFTRTKPASFVFAGFNFGKYKGILISVALFLLLDASVLMLNFFISF